MHCKEVEERLPAYALNALSPEEATLVEAHVDVCPWCATLLREHAQVTASLAEAAEHHEPPRQLKSRILKAARKQLPQRPAPRQPFLAASRLALGGAAAVMVLLLAAVIGVGLQMSDQIDGLQRENSELAAQVSQLAHEDDTLMDMFMEQRSISYIMAAPDKQVLSLTGDESVPKAQGMLLIAARGGTAILMAQGLEPSWGDEAYDVWLKTDGEGVHAGSLSVDKTGWGVLPLWPDQPITFFQQVWVTRWVEEGSSGLGKSPVLWGAITQ